MAEEKVEKSLSELINELQKKNDKHPLLDVVYSDEDAYRKEVEEALKGKKK